MNTLVVMSTKNKLGYLKMALPHCYHRAGKPADWMLIDDGSSDGTWEYIAGFAHLSSGRVKAVRNSQPRGISSNKNLGLETAQRSGYERLVFVDDDLLLSPFWLAEMLATSTVHEDYFVSPIMINDKTMLRKVEIIGWQSSWVVDGLGGACVMIPPKAFSLRFDDRETYQYEDAVFHKAAQDAGFGLMVLGNVSAVHLPWIVMLDPAGEYEKLRVRHAAIGGSPDTLRESFQRDYDARLNGYIKELEEA